MMCVVAICENFVHTGINTGIHSVMVHQIWWMQNIEQSGVTLITYVQQGGWDQVGRTVVSRGRPGVQGSGARD